MNQTKKAKGYVVEVFHAHQNTLDSHIYTTEEDARKALVSPDAGKVYAIQSKHSSDSDGFTYIWADGVPASQVFAEEIDADEARTAYLHSHPNHKDPGKVVALKAI